MASADADLHSFSDFVTDLDTERRKLTVLNRTEPDPVYEMLARTFAEQQDNVDIWEVETRCGKPEDAVILEDDDGVIAVSTLQDIETALLLVNSDIYVTGTRSLADVDTPDVIARMGDTRLYAEGYPSPREQKMLLIEISRYIEARAWRAGGGTLYSGFQTLSRIDDESGTREAYEALGDTDVDVHVFGVPDWDPPDSMGVIPHGHDVPDVRESWFVVYEPPRDPDRKVALVAVQVGDNRWTAVWTHDNDRVDRVREYVVDRYV